MVNKYSTSVNIIRDTERDFNYIPTPNAKRVVNQIVNDFKKGIRSFNVVGTYGTGKSSFLLALEQSINGFKRYFEPNFITEPKVEFIKIIGSYNSILEKFAEIFDVNTSKNLVENILSEIFNKYHSINKENKILFLLIDEFGKFLEYASKNNPENELYFLQQLAEFCNNPKYNIILITTVHQSLESYAYSLETAQRQEWTKVKGRFREITFNEPVEQLLYLAAKHIEKNNIENVELKRIEKSLFIIKQSKVFNINEDFIDEIVSKIFPLDLLSANILTLSLQKYGQNERSLFSFLESTDRTGIIRFDRKDNPFYNLSNVYDYLNFNFYSFLTSKYNPDFSSWISIRNSIDIIERSFDSSINDYFKTVKTIGLLNVFAANGSILDLQFLENYLEIVCGIEFPRKIIKELENKNIIRYRSHNKRYILFEGTDLDIENAIVEAGNKVTEVEDVAFLINKHIQLDPVFVKQYSFATGTPRYFNFIISENPISEIPKGETDGFINLIFNSKLKPSDIENYSKNQNEAILYCFFKNSKEIKNNLFEIEKIEKVIEENKDDIVAKRELISISNSHKTILINALTKKGLYSKNENVVWYFKGLETIISNKSDFNKVLSQVCDKVYYATPVFKNELVNKTKISPSIYTAKKNYFRALINNWDKENLGFDESKFPPEKTIYLSLIKENNISLTNTFTISEESSFKELWYKSEEFLKNAKLQKLKVSEFIDVLSMRPFKLKHGFIDFWVPTFLFLKRDDFAVFNENGYIPNLSEENLELIAKLPEKYSIKTFDVEGVKLDIFKSYRKFLDQTTDSKFSNLSFIETIKPFIVFYKQLPEYTKNTKRLTTSALKIRDAIAKSKDPEQTFFESFPNALGVSLLSFQNDPQKLQEFTAYLQNAIKELRTAFDELIKRFEEFLCAEFVGENIDFDNYKLFFQKRYSKLKKHLLLSGQKTFIQRLDSSLDDRKAWLNSIAQAVIGKTFDMFTDDDEILLYERFKSIILELDSLTKISKVDIDENKEEVIGVKIDSFFSKIDPKVVRIPKNKSIEIENLKTELKNKLGKDKTSNIAAVLNLLKELLQ